MPIDPIPERYRAAIPYLNVSDGAAAVDFYERAFGARIETRLGRPDGKLAHAEVRIGEAMVMVRDEIPELGFHAPATIGGTPVQILVYVEDAERLVERASAAGARIVRPVEEQFHGDVMATLEDPFGYVWFFATHVEDVDTDDLAQRSAAYEPTQR
jgi:PhnB protein